MGFKYEGHKLYFKKKTAERNRRKGERTLKCRIHGETLYRNKKY